MGFVIWCLVFFLTAPLGAEAGTIIKAPTYLGLNSGLVGYWTFDGLDTHQSSNKTDDKSGNGNSGTLTNGPTAIPGKIGQALNFNGVNSYVAITNNTSSFPLYANNTAYSISVWVKGDKQADKVVWGECNGGPPCNSSTLFGLGTDASGNTGKVDLYLTNGVTTPLNDVLSTGVAFDKSWHHIVWTDNNGTANLYIDGSKDATSFNYTRPSFSSTSNLIGNQAQSLSQNFNGSIDDVRIYNRVLSATEIQRLYTIGSGSKFNHSTSGGSSTTGDPLSRGLTGYWTFDGADMGSSGTIAKDRSGKNFNGTLNGSLPPTIAPGKVGQGLKFNGTASSYVSTTAPLSSYMSANDGTFSVWVYPTANGSDNNACVQGQGEEFIEDSDNSSGNHGGYFAIGKGTSNICGLCSGTSFLNNVVSSPTVLNQWNMYTLTHTGGNMYFYKNGSLISSKACDTISDLVGTVGMGNNYSAATPILNNAILDDARVYNRALSGEEISRLYQQTQTKFNASKTQSLTNGLVGYWTMDGADIHSSNKMDDKSGNGNSGTLTNGPTKVPGKIGQALNFGGPANTAVTTSGSLLNNLGPMSISVWIKPSNYGASSAMVLSKSLSFSGQGWLLDVYTSGQSLRLGVSYGTQNLTAYSANNSVDLNRWQHWIITWDGSTTASNVHFFKNGTEVVHSTPDDTDGLGTKGSDTGTLSIGLDNESLGRTYFGLIDDVRIYNRALSVAEIQKLYQMGK